MLRTVLVPTDLDGDAELVMAFGRGLPALGVKRVVLVNVVDTTGLEGPVADSTMAEARGRLRELARPLEDAGIPVEARVLTGTPQDEVLSAAEQGAVDAVVCGSHGRAVVDQLFLGSVSDRLLRESEVPRLVARFDLLKNVQDPGRMCAAFASKVLVPTDFSASAGRAFEAALELPSKAVGTMYILHALDPALSGDERRLAEEAATAKLKEFENVARQRGINAASVVRFADPVHAVLAEVDERRMTGVVMGTRGRSPLQEALLGSVSMALLRQASCPVMVVS